MIGSLHIKNIGIIDEININLNEGFNIFTGETGAGKTLIIDSLQILAGGRFSKDIIRHGEKSSFVEMLVYLKEEEYIISREVNQSGRNICKINGRLVTVNELKAFMKKVIDIHGQQDNGDDKEKQRKLDLLEYQKNEIENADLYIGEEEELDEKLKKIMNAEKIQKNLEESHYILSEGILSELNQAVKMIEKISDYDENYEKIRSGLQSSYYDLEEAERDLYNYKENIYFDEGERIKIESRIDLIQDLKRKYGNNVAEILEYQKEVEEQIKEIENLSTYIEKLKKEKIETEEILDDFAKQMHYLREKYSKIMAKRINNELQDLEMLSAKFSVEIKCRTEFNTQGKDNVEFLIQTNVGEEAKPLIKIASGGEMSRIMLGIKKVLADVDQVPVLIFDEIDTGISGIAAKKVGTKMKEISKNHQIICVTHLAQIAAKGDYNYFIRKEVENHKTNTKIEQLDEDGVIKEIARIATGEINEISLKHAQELRKEKVA